MVVTTTTIENVIKDYYGLPIDTVLIWDRYGDWDSNLYKLTAPKSLAFEPPAPGVRKLKQRTIKITFPNDHYLLIPYNYIANHRANRLVMDKLQKESKTFDRERYIDLYTKSFDKGFSNPELLLEWVESGRLDFKELAYNSYLNGDPKGIMSRDEFRYFSSEFSTAVKEIV